MLRQPADRLWLYVKLYVFLLGSIKPETFKPLFNLGKVYFFSLCVNTFPSTQRCTDNTSFPLFTPDRHVVTFLRGMHFDQWEGLSSWVSQKIHQYETWWKVSNYPIKSILVHHFFMQCYICIGIYIDIGIGIDSFLILIGLVCDFLE